MNQYIILLILLYLARQNGCLSNCAFWCLAGLCACESGLLNSLFNTSGNGCSCNSCNPCCN